MPAPNFISVYRGILAYELYFHIRSLAETNLGPLLCNVALHCLARTGIHVLILHLEGYKYLKFFGRLLTLGRNHNFHGLL